MEGSRTTPECRTNRSHAEEDFFDGVSCSSNAEPSSSQKDDKLAVTEAKIEEEEKPLSKWVETDELRAGNPNLEDFNNGVTLAQNHNPSIQKQNPSRWNNQSDLYYSGNHMISGNVNFSAMNGNQFSDGNHIISGTVRRIPVLEGLNNGINLADHNPSIQKQNPSRWSNQSDIYYSGNHMISGNGNFSAMNGNQFSDGNHMISGTVRRILFLEGLNNGINLASNHDPSIQKQNPQWWSNQSDIYYSGNHMISGNGNFSAMNGNQFSGENHMISGTVRRIPVLEGLNNGINLAANHDPSIQKQNSSWWKYQSDLYYSGNHMISGNGKFSAMNGDQFSDQNHIVNDWRSYGGSEKLQRLLLQGNQEEIHNILVGLLGSLFELMTDDHGRHVFKILVVKCNNNQLQLILDWADIESDRFIAVALESNGAKSIRKLVNRITWIPPMEIALTNILCKRSFELLTHKIASHVIRKCFVMFGKEPIFLFFHSVAPRILDLAKHRVGCFSLNKFLDIITGANRYELLKHLADYSLFLSIDHSGSFVVQYLLDLNNQEVTETVLARLTGKFEQLAQTQQGNHVIQKCICCSQLGLEVVVSEISKNEKTLLQLAQNQFATHVILTALKQAKMTSDKRIYMQLLYALRPSYHYLLRETNGRNIAELIKDDIGLQFC